MTRRLGYLRPLYAGQPGRAGRDRLEILTALIGAPSFDPLFRAEVIQIPRGHPVYRWECVVDGCERTRSAGGDLCSVHALEFVSPTGASPSSKPSCSPGKPPSAERRGLRVWT